MLSYGGRVDLSLGIVKLSIFQSIESKATFLLCSQPFLILSFEVHFSADFILYVLVYSTNPFFVDFVPTWQSIYF